jgi:hypothetical protein
MTAAGAAVGRVPLLVLVVLAIAAHSGCRKANMSQKPPPPANSAEPAPPAGDDGGLRAWWLQAACKEVTKAPRLRGRAEADVEKGLGPPARRETFRMAERQDEFRIELQNTYPLSDPKNRDVAIREWTWDRPGCHLTVWLHEVGGAWSVLDAVVWPEGTEF